MGGANGARPERSAVHARAVLGVPSRPASAAPLPAAVPSFGRLAAPSPAPRRGPDRAGPPPAAAPAPEPAPLPSPAAGPGQAEPEDPWLEDLAARLEHRFARPELLALALTHASAKDTDGRSNQRIEFLGDAVLGLVVAEHLFASHPEHEEGPLTRRRSALVSTAALARVAGRLRLGQAARLGRGLRLGPMPDSVLANLVEAVFGAVFLDGGLEAARRVILRVLGPDLAVADDASSWKSRLQERTQRVCKEAPVYVVLGEWGPEHKKHFEVAVRLGDRDLAAGAGPSKRAAEEAAAEAAYAALSRPRAPAPPPEARALPSFLLRR